MITKKMNDEANVFATALKADMVKQPKTELRLHPELNTYAMHRDMSGTHSVDQRHPRNFFDNTRNQETMKAFIGGRDTTGTYRQKYENMQDDSGKWQVQTANDLALRNMLNTHKDEMLKADWDQKDTIALQHKFETSFFHAKEARFDFDKRPDKALAPREVEKLETQAHTDYRAYKADKLGILPNQAVEVETQSKTNVEQRPLMTRKAESEIPKLPSFTERMEAMRNKHNITQKPTLSRSM